MTFLKMVFHLETAGVIFAIEGQRVTYVGKEALLMYNTVVGLSRHSDLLHTLLSTRALIERSDVLERRLSWELFDLELINFRTMDLILRATLGWPMDYCLLGPNNQCCPPSQAIRCFACSEVVPAAVTYTQKMKEYIAPTEAPLTESEVQLEPTRQLPLFG